MRKEASRFWEVLTAAAAVLVLVAALPLLGVAVFVLRFVVVAAAVVALVGGIVLGLTSQRFRDWFRACIEPELEYKGLRLATDVGLSPAHSWARVEPDGAFVGIDDLAEGCLGPVQRVELPTPGRRVRRGEPLFTLGRDTRRLQGRSPVSGTVIAVNEALKSDPGRINRDPFGLGWVARLRPDDARQSRRQLMRGLQAEEWFRQEVDRVVGTLGGDPAALPSLPDGGVLVGDLHRAVDDATWRHLVATFFSEPADPRPEDPS